jgi:hypothetical protein
VTWLDEIAEGLKKVMSAINRVIVNLIGVSNADGTSLFLESKAVEYFQSVLRSISHTFGIVASRLID